MICNGHNVNVPCWSNVLHLLSGNSELSINIYQTTQCNIPGVIDLDMLHIFEPNFLCYIQAMTHVVVHTYFKNYNSCNEYANNIDKCEAKAHSTKNK